jgi:hypothetical protein
MTVSVRHLYALRCLHSHGARKFREKVMAPPVPRVPSANKPAQARHDSIKKQHQPHNGNAKSLKRPFKRVATLYSGRVLEFSARKHGKEGPSGREAL